MSCSSMLGGLFTTFEQGAELPRLVLRFTPFGLGVGVPDDASAGVVVDRARREDGRPYPHVEHGASVAAHVADRTGVGPAGDRLGAMDEAKGRPLGAPSGGPAREGSRQERPVCR